VVETLDPAALDAFTGELLANGYEPTTPEFWVGPIAESLRGLTTAETMIIRLYDGWPYHPPAVFAAGLSIGRHRNSAGHICLWESGDPSLEWLTLPGIISRIEKWASEAQGDATASDPGLDPHLVFVGGVVGLATINLTDRPVAGPAMDDLSATEKDGVLKIGAGDLRGRWYAVDPAPQLPQRLVDLDAYLTPEQLADLHRVVDAVGQPDARTFLVFAWNTPVGPNLLILKLERSTAGTMEVRPYEAARTDKSVLLLRAGPDAATLMEQSVAIFGVGAIGSHVAALLARSGLGELVVFDYERLRPGDIVRHAGLPVSVGAAKVDAVELINMLAAPWTTTQKRSEAAWKPSRLAEIARTANLVIDATGSANLTAQLGEVCRQQARPLLSVALYRRGFVGRVRYQACDTQMAIIDRPAEARFPLIPAGPDEEGAQWEAGCMAAVAQAAPTAVIGIAATAARVAIAALTGRDRRDRDVLEVYQPLGEAPFDQIGTTTFR
jgi:molybdopterin/thiamine biosynthesis adenylyltransferase